MPLGLALGKGRRKRRGVGSLELGLRKRIAKGMAHGIGGRERR